MIETLKLPCAECCELDLTCCKNPQILFTMLELDNLINDNDSAMEGKILYKGEVPGTVYIINRPPDGVNNIVLDYCAFYSIETKNCSIYDHRPSVCSAYGNPKYNRCPYDEYTEPGELQKLNEDNPELAVSLHGTIGSNPEAYLEDFLKPWVEAFNNSKEENPEYYEFWEELPAPNFIRNQELRDSFYNNLNIKEIK